MNKIKTLTMNKRHWSWTKWALTMNKTKTLTMNKMNTVTMNKIHSAVISGWALTMNKTKTLIIKQTLTMNKIKTLTMNKTNTLTMNKMNTLAMNNTKTLTINKMNTLTMNKMNTLTMNKTNTLTMNKTNTLTTNKMNTLTSRGLQDSWDPASSAPVVTIFWPTANFFLPIKSWRAVSGLQGRQYQPSVTSNMAWGHAQRSNTGVCLLAFLNCNPEVVQCFSTEKKMFFWANFM